MKASVRTCCCHCKCNATVRGIDGISQGTLIRTEHGGEYIRTAAGIVDLDCGAFYYTHNVRDWNVTPLREGEIVHLSN